MIKVGDQVKTWYDPNVCPSGYAWHKRREAFAGNGEVKIVEEIHMSGTTLKVRSTHPMSIYGAIWIPLDCCQLVVQPATIHPPIPTLEGDAGKEDIKALRDWIKDFCKL